MKNLIIVLMLSFIIAVLANTFNIFSFSNWTSIEKLYTVVGIIFSVSMSLLISFSTNEIKDIGIKNNIRRSIDKTTKNNVIFFVGATLCFMLFDEDSNKDDLFTICRYIAFRKTQFTALFLFMSILYFMISYIELCKEKNRLEDCK